VLEVVHALGRARLAPVPGIFAEDLGRAGAELRDALGPVDRVAGEVVGIEILTPFDVGGRVVRVFVSDAEVVVDVALMVGAGATTGAEGGHGLRILESPGDAVDVVATLLDDAVTAQPGEVVPVGDLPLGVTHPVGAARRIGHGLDGAGVVDRVNADDVTDGAVVDALEESPTLLAVAVAEAAENREILLRRDLAGGEEVLHPGDVGGAGFLDKGVDPRFDGGLEMNRAEGGGSCQQDDVHARIDDLLVGIDSAENTAVEALGELVFGDGRLAHHREFFLRLGEVEIAGGPELDIVVGREGIQHRAAAPSTGADNADLEFLVVGGTEGHAGKADRCHRGGGHTGGLHETASRRISLGIFCLLAHKKGNKVVFPPAKDGLEMSCTMAAVSKGLLYAISLL